MKTNGDREDGSKNRNRINGLEENNKNEERYLQ